MQRQRQPEKRVCQRARCAAVGFVSILDWGGKAVQGASCLFQAALRGGSDAAG
ncbi:hypothetical protein GCWU000324_00616 [Kingella oralis ATCC 51147]|uniref:Uncharacterized protein n=1 Tax=Kingella oralis ATCC 51147 TaxID=629741 RepID=C4GIC4_9NEIS|nr:hypothetical protein GCWU000324_00616 [Kingella oralis ATCC 51147]